jgi:hypothetical protein
MIASKGIVQMVPQHFYIVTTKLRFKMSRKFVSFWRSTVQWKIFSTRKKKIKIYSKHQKAINNKQVQAKIQMEKSLPCLKTSTLSFKWDSSKYRLISKGHPSTR